MYSPTLEEFLNLAAQGNVIPVTRRLLADIETPLSAYRKIRGPGESFLFESVEGGEHLGRYSFVGCNPRAVIRQDGHVESVHLLKHLDLRLDQSAEDALAKWVFEPALRNGIPMDVEAVFEIPFHLAPKLVR